MPQLLTTAALLSLSFAVACSAPGAPSVPSPAKTSAKTTAPNPAPLGRATVPADDYLDVFVLGDFGTGGPGQRQMANVIQSAIADAEKTLLLTTGDNFYTAGVTSVDDEKWKLRIEDVYGSFGLLMYATLGNHDHRGNTQAQVDYTKKSGMWRMPNRYYAFTTEVARDFNVRFVAMDTTRLRSGDDDAQEQWLKAELSQRRASYTIVFGHHPLYSAGPHGDDAEFQAVVAPLLNSDVVDIFMAGHDHILQVVGEHDGILHLVCGGGSGDDRAYPIASEPGVFAMTGGGAMRLRIQSGNIQIGLISDDGALKYTHMRARRTDAVTPPAAHPSEQSTRP